MAKFLSKAKFRDSSNKFVKADLEKKLNPNSTFQIKEAYNTIRTNLMFSQHGEKCPVFVVTSATANNGKTINSVNMAINFARMGKKTLIIDSDMRNPTVHKLFSLKTSQAKNGLSEYLAGINDNLSFLKTEVENLSILTAGTIPPNPVELLSSPRMEKLLDFAKLHFDYIIIDAPPINIVTDAITFAKSATGYIVIVRTDITNTADVKMVVNNLNQIGANILGFIVNDVNSDKKKYYSYYSKYGGYKYGYGYGSYGSYGSNS